MDLKELTGLGNRPDKYPASPPNNRSSPSPRLQEYTSQAKGEDNEIRSENGSGISSTSVLNASSDQLQFTENLRNHYNYIVKLLPTLMIFLPSLLKLLSPQALRMDRVFIEDEPSNVLSSFFSILLICWVIKFLLEWPWEWYLQINEAKLKLSLMLDNMSQSTSDTHNGNNNGEFEKIAGKSFGSLKFQHFIALAFCLITPFLSGLILMLSREYISVSGNSSSKIFSDLNIGVFISCGLIRVIIQISENIQQSTASIEQRIEKYLMEKMFNQDDRAPEFNFRSNGSSVVTRYSVEEKLNLIEERLNQLSELVEYLKPKIVANESQNFLKHYKILEKEINQLNLKLETRNEELETKLNIKQIQAFSSAAKPCTSAASIHGIQLTSTAPRASPLLPTDYLNSADSSREPVANEQALKDLTNLNAMYKFDLQSRPIVQYALQIPFTCKNLVWQVTSYVPLVLLRFIYYLLLVVLDMLTNISRGSNQEKLRL